MKLALGMIETRGRSALSKQPMPWSRQLMFI